MTQRRLQGRRVVVGIGGGIAAYKAIEVVRLLTEAGTEVRVMMTPEATRFVTPLTLEALSYHPVAADWLAPQGAGESHIALAEWADLIAIVPATANSLAKLALGLADEIVSGTVLASRAPLLVAPAMNDLMYTYVKQDGACPGRDGGGARGGRHPGHHGSDESGRDRRSRSDECHRDAGGA